MIKKIIAVFMAIMMVFGTIPIDVFASNSKEPAKFEDMPENWSRAALENAVENGLLSGVDGKIMPNEKLTRAQMATVITRAFGAKDKGNISKFSDVKASDWFYDSMSKAYKMGVIKGSNNKLNPKEPITRQEAFVMIARAFKLESADVLNKSFEDTDQISDWAKEEVYSVINNGYIQGSNGKINPKGNITRAEFAQVFYNIVKEYIQTEGTYKNFAKGNIMVSVPNVILKDLTIEGDLIIGDGVGEGDVTLDNVKVRGRMVVRGGGENSIIIKGNSDISNIIVAKVDGVVSIKVQGDANVEIIYIDDESDDVNIEGQIGNLQVIASGIIVSAIDSQIKTIDIIGKNSKVIIDKDSKVENININKEAVGIKLEVVGIADKVTTQAPNTQITGKGKVSKVEVKEGGNNAKIETTNTKIQVDKGVTGVTLPPTPPSPSSSGGSSSGGTTVVSVSAININKSTTTLVEGTTETLTVTFTPSNASNKTITWTTSDASKATIDSTGKVRAVSAGTATITAKSNNGKTATCVVTVTTTVVPVSAISVSPGTLTLTAGGATGTLTATVSPAGATNKNVTWASSNTSVATVAGGVVTPLTAGTTTITATTVDGGFSKTVDVTVNPAPVTLVSIAITTPATKLAYNVGETLDIAGLVVTGTYSDSSTKAETITTANISGFNSSTVAASQTLTVTVNGKMTSYVISIVKKAGPILTGVTADNVTNTVTGMAATMEFSTDGITWVKYNETTPNLPDLTGEVDLQVRFASTDTHEAGPATTFNFTAATLESIAVKTPATKLVYKVGETLDITGLVIEGTYSDASKKNVSITAANITGFNSSAVVASQTLTVTVDGKTVTYTIEIKAATLESIAIKTPATKLVYKVGETLDITGLVIEGTYSNGSKKNEAITVANVTGFDSSAVAASQTLTVTVDGKTVTYTVEIKAATLVSIAVKTPATKLVYTLGETLDIAGLVIEGTYSDTSKKDETITAANVSGFDSSAVVASQTLTVTVDGKTTTYTVEIKPAATLSSIAVKTPATKLVYAVGETLDITGLVIEGTYSDSSKRIITITSSNVSGFNSSAVVASQTLTVTVDGKTTTYTIEVQAVSVTGVSLNQTTMSLKVGTGTGTLTATIAPANATDKTVTWTSSVPTIATVDINGKVTPVATGTTTITVTTADGSKTATCTVTVTAANIATQVFVGGVGEPNTLKSDFPYWVNGARSKTGTLGSEGCTAFFDHLTGILTLRNYTGGAISSGLDSGKDFIVKLEGINTVNGASTGISNDGGGDIYITADNDATLTVNTVSADNFSYAIATGYNSGYPSGSVIIGGKAKVTVTATSTSYYKATGIRAEQGDVTIQEDARFTATLNADLTNGESIGIKTKKLIINTTGDIEIDCSNSKNGIVLYSNSLDIVNVNLMTLKAPTDGGFIFKAPVLPGVAVNEAGKVASYRSGTPYTIEVKNGEITGVAAGVIVQAGQPYQALANDTITIKSKIIPLFKFVKWMDAEGNDLDASLFTGGTTASSPEAKIKMPAKDLNIKAEYKSTLFTTKPSFHRGDEKITWKISQAADFGYLQKKTGETWGDTSISLPRTLEGTATVQNNPVNHYVNAPDGTYRLAFYFNPNDNEFLKHYSEQFEIAWNAQLAGTVTISGTPKSGATLTANAIGTQVDAGELKYQWFADSTEISGATEKTLVLGADQVGKQIKVKVSSHNYNMPIESAPTAAVAKADGPGAIDSYTGTSEVETNIKLAGLGASTPNLEVAVAIDGSTYDEYRNLFVDGDGKAWIFSLTGVNASTKVKVRIKESPTHFAGADREITVTVAAVDKTALTTAITDANTNKVTAVVSIDGFDIDPANKWVTSAEMVAYELAISTAQGVADNTGATQTEVNNAVTVLDTATSTFNTAKKTGTKPAADTTPPVITATDKIVPIANLAAWTEPVSANDNFDGNITAKVVATYFESNGTTSLTDLAAAKTYIGDATTNTSFVIKYNVSDAAGNEATEVTVTITVTKANVPDSISVGGKTLNSTTPYLVDGVAATEGTLGADKCTAHFDPITGVLSLQDYAGGEIRINEAGKDLRIKLIGNANKITGGQFGIHNDKGDIHVTSDSVALLEIEINSSSGGAAIANGWMTMTENPSVFIGGKVKLTIKAEYTGDKTTNSITGIYAGRGSVTIQDQADYSATLTNPKYQGRGILSEGKTIINTSGNIEIDVSNSDRGVGIDGYGGIEIKQVNSMLITIPSTGGTNTKFTSGTVDVLSGVAVNKSATKASYRSGTPYTLGLVGGKITTATGDVIGSPHQYLVDDKITIESTISEANFDRWTKANGAALETALFINSTTAKSATATIKMPAESLSIKARENETGTVIDIAAISGVVAPVTGATPVTKITDTAQYTGTVTWSPKTTKFAGDTAYTATITLKAKPGFKLDGVAANYFTVAGAATVTNEKDTGEIIAVFPATEADKLIDIAAIPGVVAPVTGATPVTKINDTDQYTGKVAWTPANNPFAAETVYTATIKLTAKPGFKLDGVAANFFTVAGADTVTNEKDTGEITAVFPATAASDFALGSGTKVDPYQVSSAEELNKVRNHLDKHFKQTANIDLSTYNTDGGWKPIGDSTTPFKGTYDGDSKDITGLCIDRPDATDQGLFGFITYGSVLENISLITVNVEGKLYVGGLVGHFNNGTITSCNVVGTVNGKDYVGGLVGRQSFGTITSSYTSGTVNGTDIVGGLVGSVESGSEVKVTNSYSLASVTVTTNGRVGGLVGLNWKAIENCYAAGQVTGNGTNAGGLVGQNLGTLTTITSSYYDSEKTGQSDEGKGVKKTTAEMKQAATFTGWDTSIWNIKEGSYPTLR